MDRYEAGSPFGLAVVCNGGDERPLALPGRFDHLAPRVLNRENVGYNLAAWDLGWRQSPGYEFYLFLQDDCFLKRAGWVSAFEFRMDRDRGVGLLGELSAYEGMTWDYVRLVAYEVFQGPRSSWPEPAHPIDAYRETFERHGIPWDDLAAHLASLVLFTRGSILAEVGGMPFLGPSKREAITAELAVSRLIAARGYRLAKVGLGPFEYIGHREWTPTGHGRQPGLRGRAHAVRCALGDFAARCLGRKKRFHRPVAWPPPATDRPAPATGGCSPVSS
jgi:hypothetical protein